MASTYTLISSQVLASSAASVTFSSIPATYTDLVLKVSARTDVSAVTDTLVFYLNYAPSLWSQTNVSGSGTAATSTRTTSVTYFGQPINGNTSTSNTFTNTEIYIPSYNASQNKPISGFSSTENNTAASTISSGAGLWRSTAAISAITLTPLTGTNFVTNSSFYLYGISNA